MKIYSKVVIEIETGKVLEENSFEYEGPLGLCGGSGGGGGSSGEVSWPDYLETAHEDALAAVKALIPATANPYTGLTSYDPATRVTSIQGALTDFETAIDSFDPVTDWSSMIVTVISTLDTNLFDSSDIDDDITAYGTLLSADITTNVLPRFRAGMRNINAVHSSAFTIGEANIEAERVRSLAKYGTEMKAKYAMTRVQAINDTGKLLSQLLSEQFKAEKDLAHYLIEGNRISIVAEKEQRDTQVELDKEEGKWDFEEYQYLANMLAAPSGGTATAGGGKGPSGFQSAIGGAMSGAAAGNMLMPGGAGAIVGGVIGLGASLF